MLRAQEIPESFNMFVLHQNRSRHSNLTYVPDDQLPEFLNFIMWGHEHECRINPEYYDNPGYWICQPGEKFYIYIHYLKHYFANFLTYFITQILISTLMLMFLLNSI